MCDSHISESCPMDFTNYCPVDSICSEGRYKRPTHKPQTKNHNIAWFSRKAKGLPPHSTKPPNCELLGAHETCEASGYSHALENHTKAVDSSGEDYGDGCSLGRRQSLEKASRYVSQEELDALKGCVTRRRAMFSPSPSSSPVHPYVQLKQSPSHTNSLPAGGKYRFRAEEAKHVRQSSLEYDHLKDFDPHEPVTNIADSVSVQFRLQGNEESAGGNGVAVHNGFNKDSPLSYRKVVQEKCDSDGHEDEGACASVNTSKSKHVHACSCDLRSSQETDGCGSGVCNNSWPRGEVFLIKGATEPLKEGRVMDTSSLWSGLSNLFQHPSPLHSKFNSPLLLHQVHGFSSLKTCDTGSSYSLYSQTTTASDRQHCSYSKGVDGNLFKERADVSLIKGNIIMDAT